MKKFFTVLAVLGCLVLVVLVAGAGMKAEHVARATRLYAARPERVWTALLSIRQLPFDRSDLANIDNPIEKNRVPASLEVLGSPIRIEAPTQRPPVQLVVKTVEPGLAYSGTWTIVLTPEAEQTRVTIVEDAIIRSRALRFFVRTVLGDDVLLEGIFRAVNRKLTEGPRAIGS